MHFFVIYVLVSSRVISLAKSAFLMRLQFTIRDTHNHRINVDLVNDHNSLKFDIKMTYLYMLQSTHWCQVTYIYISKQTIIDSANGLNQG